MEPCEPPLEPCEPPLEPCEPLEPPLEPHEFANAGPAPRAKARTLDEARVKKDRRVFIMGTPRVL